MPSTNRIVQDSEIKENFVNLIRVLFEIHINLISIETGEMSEDEINKLYQLNRTWNIATGDFDNVWHSGWNSSRTEFKFERTDSVLILPLSKQRGHTLFPFFSLLYRPGDKFEQSCIRIFVFLLESVSERGYNGFGFRIESPETYCQEGGNPGMHDFYHAQLIDNMRYGDSLDLPDWWPIEQPSFPLWATNPIDAMLNLILTLYGARFYKDFLKSHGNNFASGMSDEFKKFNDRYVE